MPIANVNNINLHYEITGHGEPLLLIMGLGGDSSHWGLQIPAFASYFQVIAFDNRGVGRSDAPADPYSIAIMAQDAAALLDHLNIPSAHVLGFSMGGYIAQQLAIQFPKKVKSLVLSHSVSKSPERTLYLMATLTKMAEAGVSRELRLRATIPWMFSANFLSNEEQLNILTTLALNSLYPQTKQGYVNQISAIKQHDITMLIHQLTMPVLLLTSQEDLLVPPTLVKQLQQRIPHAELNVLEQGGHCTYIEDAANYNHAVLQFLLRMTSQNL